MSVLGTDQKVNRHRPVSIREVAVQARLAEVTRSSVPVRYSTPARQAAVTSLSRSTVAVRAACRSWGCSPTCAKMR